MAQSPIQVITCQDLDERATREKYKNEFHALVIFCQELKKKKKNTA